MTTGFLLTYLVLWILVVCETIVLLGLVVGYQRLQRLAIPRAAGQLGLAHGSKPLPFRANDTQGSAFANSDLIGQAQALLFVSPTCPSCRRALEDLAGVRHKAGDNVVVVVQGARSDALELQETYQLPRTIVDSDGEVAGAFAISRFPTAVLLDATGRVESYGLPDSKDDVVRTDAAAGLERGAHVVG